LSHQPGGVDVAVETRQGKVPVYRNVHYPRKYIRTIWDNAAESLSEANTIRIYSRHHTASRFRLLWESESNQSALDALQRLELGQWPMTKSKDLESEPSPFKRWLEVTQAHCPSTPEIEATTCGGVEITWRFDPYLVSVQLGADGLTARYNWQNIATLTSDMASFNIGDQAAAEAITMRIRNLAIKSNGLPTHLQPR
jgi:hypothetical protein